VGTPSSRVRRSPVLLVAWTAPASSSLETSGIPAGTRVCVHAVEMGVARDGGSPTGLRAVALGERACPRHFDQNAMVIGTAGFTPWPACSPSNTTVRAGSRGARHRRHRRRRVPRGLVASRSPLQPSRPRVHPRCRPASTNAARPSDCRDEIADRADACSPANAGPERSTASAARRSTTFCAP